MTSSIYPISVTAQTGVANTEILTSDILISADQVKPGGGAILRIYFSFVFTTTPGTIGVYKDDILKGNLNADNDSQVIDDGYYRFDLDVEAGDVINFKLKTTTGGGNITTVNFFRAHLVQFGA